MDLKSLLISLLFLILSVALITTLVKTNSYILDLLSNATLYLLVISGLACLALLSWQIFHHQLLTINVTNLSTLLLGLTTLLVLAKVAGSGFLLPSFATPAQASDSSARYKIGFFNKLYSNTNYSTIEQTLASLNLDLIGFAEFKSIDAKHIPTLKTYPYHLTQDARDQATLTLYSKHPVTLNSELSIPYVLPTIITLNQEQYHLFVIHPMPPINNQWMKGRDEQLSRLAQYINTLPNPDRIIIMGDFNTSIWSPVYQNFSQQLPNLKNAAQGVGLKTTWHNKLLRAQIDHLLVPLSSTVRNFNSLKVEGSDHNLIWAELGI